MLTKLELHHFRSYNELSLDFSDRILVILGPNATGKTNILEALFVAATGRSWRAKDEALVEYNQPGYRIQVDYTEETIAVGFTIKPNKAKRFLRNDVAISRQTLLGLHPVVLFEPGDLQLFHGGPVDRRRYLDLLLCQTHPEYAQAYLQFRRLLRQRNSLLWKSKQGKSKQGRIKPGQTNQLSVNDLNDQLFVLNTLLCEPVEEIYVKRQAFLKWLEPQVNHHVSKIANAASQLVLNYADKSSDFLRRLENSQARDLIIGTTTVGPHREDWGLERDSIGLNLSASRGEIRTVLLGLKLAEIDYLRAQTDVSPLLLLDDVFSELDESRRHFLISEIGDVQTIITTTDIDKRLDLPAQTLDLTRGLK